MDTSSILENARNYTEQLNIRLRPDEKDALERKARRSRRNTAEWAREILLGTVSFSPDYRALLAEFLGMRTLVLNLCSELAQGRALSPESIKQFVANAEAKKLQMADERIARYLDE